MFLYYPTTQCDLVQILNDIKWCSLLVSSACCKNICLSLHWESINVLEAPQLATSLFQTKSRTMTCTLKFISDASTSLSEWLLQKTLPAVMVTHVHPP